MIKNMTTNGLKLGVLYGLTTTFFDSFYMLLSDIPVLFSYPIHLLTVNIFFWTMLGGLTGFIGSLFWKCVKSSPPLPRHWLWFYLLPFSVIYGLLGKMNLNSKLFPPAYKINNLSVFDNSLSLLWIIAVLAISFRFHKTTPARKTLSTLFLPEIFLTSIIFIFCHLIIPVAERKISITLGMAITFYAVGVLLIICTHWFSLPKLKSWQPRERSLTIGLFLLVCLTLTACYQVKTQKLALRVPSPAFTKVETKDSQSTNVILVVLDTVRADRLSIYGGDSRVGENLVNFAKDSLVFENGIASSSWTFPSHASLFTGLYPVEHGAHPILQHNKTGPFGRLPMRKLDEKFNTLAEIFNQEQYRTLAVISNFGYFNPTLGLGQGFQILDRSKGAGYIQGRYPFAPILYNLSFLSGWLPRYTLPYRTAEEITNSTINYIDQISEGPFFLFVNYNDAHGPVMPPRPYNSMFYKGFFPLRFRLTKILPWQFKRKYLPSLFTNIKKERSLYDLSQYDGAITYIDHHLGRLFKNLKKRGLYESSLIVVTSDHGELFGEHGLSGHKKILYEGQLSVPLLIKFPYSQKIGRDKNLTGLHDIFTNILSACKIPIPKDISGQLNKNTNSSIVAEFYDNKNVGIHRVLYDANYKLMTYEKNKPIELYDIKNDPLEKKDLSTEKPEVVQIMQNKLNQWQTEHKARYTPQKISPVIPEAVRNELKALGYIQ